MALQFEKSLIGRPSRSRGEEEEEGSEKKENQSEASQLIWRVAD